MQILARASTSASDRRKHSSLNGPVMY